MIFGEIEKDVPFEDSRYPFLKMNPGESVRIDFEQDERPILYEKIRAAAYRAGLKTGGVFKCRYFREENYVRIWRRA